MKQNEKVRVLIIYKEINVQPLKEQICEKFSLESTDVWTVYEEFAAQFTRSAKPFDLIVITPEVREDIELCTKEHTEIQDLRGLPAENFLSKTKMG